MVTLECNKKCPFGADTKISVHLSPLLPPGVLYIFNRAKLCRSVMQALAAKQRLNALNATYGDRLYNYFSKYNLNLTLRVLTYFVYKPKKQRVIFSLRSLKMS